MQLTSSLKSDTEEKSGAKMGCRVESFFSLRVQPLLILGVEDIFEMIFFPGNPFPGEEPTVFFLFPPPPDH